MELVSGTANQTKDEPTEPDDLFTTETAGLSEASPPDVIRLRDGDRLDLRIEPVRKRIDDAELRMLGYTEPATRHRLRPSSTSTEWLRTSL